MAIDLYAPSEGLDATKPVAGIDLYANPNAPGPLKRGAKTALSDLKGTAGGALAVAGDVAGIDSLKNYGLDVAKRAQEESAKTSMRAEDINGFGGAVDFAKYGVGYMAPQLATAAIAGWLGRAGGALAARKIVDPAKALIARNAGMIAGLGASSIAQEAGTIYPDAVDAGMPDAAARSIVGGTLAGSLDLAPELLAAKVLGLFGKRAVSTSAKGLAGILKGGAKGAVAGAAVEGATEFGQTAIERISAGQSLTDEDAKSDFLNSTLLGAVGGAVVGGPVGALSREHGHPAAVAPGVAAPTEAVAPKAPSIEETPDTSATPTPFSGFDPRNLELQTAFEAVKPEQMQMETVPGEPQVQPKTRLAEPTIIGGGEPAVQPVRPIVTPQEDEILRLAEKESINAAQQGNFKGSIQQQRSSGEERGQAAEAGPGNRVLGATEGQRGAGGRGDVETQTALIKRSRGLLLSESEAKAVREYEKTAPAIETPVGGKPRSVTRVVTPQDRMDNFVNAYTRGVDVVLGSLTKSGALPEAKATTMATALKRAVEHAVTKPDSEAATVAFNEQFNKALKGKLPKQDIETFRQELSSYVAAQLPQTLYNKGATQMRRSADTELMQQGVEHETRLFNGGIYSPTPAEGVQGKVKPTAEVIQGARSEYNRTRATIGLPQVTDWEHAPERSIAAELVDANKGRSEARRLSGYERKQHERYAGGERRLSGYERKEHLRYAGGDRRLSGYERKLHERYGDVGFTHWGNVPGNVTNPRALASGVKGADQPLAQALGLHYTSAVVKGSTYHEPAVQGRQQYEGMIRADRVYTARADDPALATARQQVAAQYGPHEGIAWMQYAKNVRDMGYEAMRYADGQLRIFTPQAVKPVSTTIFEHVVPAISAETVNARARDVYARHMANNGSSTYVKSGTDATGMSAYSVAVFKQREVTVPGQPNLATIAKYIRANDDLLSSDAHLLGTWFNADDGLTYLDVARSVPDMKTALQLARENGQISIWDLRTSTNIPLGHPLFDIAHQYNADNGLAPIQELTYTRMNPAKGKEIARAYERLQAVNPDPAVKAAFDAMALEEEQQFNAVSKAVHIESWDKEGSPYKNSAEMRADVFGNNHLYVFAGGEPHPYRDAGQIFRGRAVHDLFGHARTGFEFGPDGELNATRMHAQMYSRAALPALIVDNIGTTAWVNFSDANEGLPQSKRAYAEQKVDLLPESLWGDLLKEPLQSRAAAEQRLNRTFEDKGTRALAYLENILGTPKDLQVRLVDDITGGVGAIRMTEAKAVIELSLNAKDVLSVAAHEGFHYLESRMFNPGEQRILREAFSNGQPLHRLLMDKARAYDKANGTQIASEIDSVPQEARAYGFEFWKRGELTTGNGVIDRIFAAIRNVMQRVSNYVNGLGFTSTEDIFNAIDRGDYARRELQGLRSGAMEQSYIQAIEPDSLPTANVLHRDKAAASAAKGRPGWIKTPADLKKMRRLLKGLAVEGDPAKNWYRRSAQAIMAWAGGDQIKAGKLASLVAMYSPRTPVGQDIRHAVQHYAQWEAGKRIDAGGTRHQAEYGSRILDGTGHRDYADKYTLPGNPDHAPKITSFFKNLMLSIDPVTYPSTSQDATIDMWMSHIFGFGDKEGKISDANYWWADAEIKKLAGEVGLAPDQVQAAIWVAIKARGNMVRAAARKEGIAKGWFKQEVSKKGNAEQETLFGKGGRVVYKLKPKQEFNYMVNWIRLALSAPFNQEEFNKANYSYAEAMRDISDNTIPLNRLDFDFELQAGLFDDIAFGKVTQGELTLFSRSASIAELAQRVNAGELPRTQLNAVWADAVDHASTPTEFRDTLASTMLSDAKGALGGLKRFYMEHLASGLNLANHSEGYKNAFNVMTAYAQRKSRLIADAVERQLSTWTGPHAGSQEDKVNVSRALLIRTENAWTKTSPELRAMREGLPESQRAMFDQATTMIGNQLDAELKADAVTYRPLFATDDLFNEWYTERATQVERLKNEGYFPERRYGDHVVYSYVPAPDGKKITVYYSQHENEASARQELAELQKLLPDQGLTFEYGYRYKADYDASLSFLQFLDIAARHGVKLTQAEKERIGKALVSADSTRRNRIFRRKNVAGYSEDGMRVLAEFGVSMANKIAYSELGRAMNDAAAGKQTDVQFTPTGDVQINTQPRNMWDLDGEQAGFYRNLVDKTLDFTMSPGQANPLSRGLRTASSVYFLGGSASAAVVNMTALAMNTAPWLTQHTSYTNAVTKLAGAAVLAGKHLSTVRDLPKLLDNSVPMEGVDEIDGLRRALQIAAQDGTVLDTEIYQIMGLSRGQEYSLSGRVQRAVRAWMYPFRLSEQFNRVTAFIATYKIAKEKGATNDAAYKLAQDSVFSTHFRYDEANRPAMARSNIGSLFFVFKSYPIFATELLATLAKEKPQAAVYMLLSYAMMAGVEGLPFEDDISDLIDVISQRIFGSPFNTKRALRNVLKSASEAITGADLSSVLLHGIANEMTGMSFASRVGLGNMIPGTRIGAADADYKKVMNDILGPVGSLITGVTSGLDSVTRGHFGEAMQQALPMAARNLTKGWSQWEKGYATDIGGRRLVDVSGPEAFWQSLGFSSSTLADAYETDSIDKQTLAYYNQVRQDLSSDLVKAMREQNPGNVADILHTVTEWNQTHPEMPLAISPANIRRQMQLANMPLNQRTLKMLPKQLRGSSEAALGLEEKK